MYSLIFPASHPRDLSSRSDIGEHQGVYVGNTAHKI